MSLDELTKQQDETGAEIERLIRNYKKDSDDRKTEEYLEEKSILLEQLWIKFDKTDQIIKGKHFEEEHSYFKREYFASVEKAYQWLLTDLKRLRNQDNPDLQGHSSGKAALKETAFVEDNKLIIVLRRLKKCMNDMKQLLAEAKILCETEPNGCAYKARLIERHWVNIEKIQEALWENTDDPETAGFDESEYKALQDDVEKTITALQKASILTPAQGKQELFDNSPQIKLPAISIPKFDGNYINWRPFHDLFLQMVHQQNLGNSQKMWYLKTSLFGEAERLIQHLTLSDENYLSAWTMLKDRYNNTRLLVSALLNKLLAQPTMHSESAVSIKALHDVTQECIMSLRNLEVNTESWDPLLLHILIKKLDNSTHNLYEQGLEQPRNLQSLQNFLTFLERRFQSLESLGNRSKNINSSDLRANRQSSTKILAATSSRICCIACKGEHQLFACNIFLKLTPEKRLRLVQTARLCVNCLRSGHRSTDCPSRNCFKCSKKHNTLLHLEKKSNNLQPQEGRINSQSSYANADLIASSKTPIASNDTKAIISLGANAPQRPSSYVLLSTAIINLTDKWGRNIEARAILDSGSQLNFISEKLAKKLGLQGIKHAMYIEGIGRCKQDTKRRINFQIHSTITGFSTNIEAHILPTIISHQPSQQLNTASWPIPGNIRLADPHFHRPGSIDLLIGADLFYSTLSVGQIQLGDDLPLLQNTVFGWTVSGRTRTNNPSPNLAHCGICGEDESLNNHLQRFWELEEAEEQPNNYTLAESKCENFFTQTTTRDSLGRIMVKLPFKLDPRKLGESSEIALQRFHSLERRLARNSELKQQYVQFMQEYLDLGHMEEVCFTMVEEPYFFLPHHCVFKPESTTTKLRVVFDGSAKTTSNFSLNDVLAIGPAIQLDVFTILLRFRMPRYVFTADMEKMYRQILLNPSDRKYQLIWWRDDVDKPLKCFTLNTVTYGTAPASYLAIRSLHKLANDVQGIYPLAAEVLKNSFYVDDVLSGSDKITTAIQMQTELISALQTAGIKMRKWCANHPQLLQQIPPNDQAIEVNFTDQSTDAVKTMGLTWHPKNDTFSIQSTWISQQRVTKRTAPSDIAHIFDPLGILAPVVITAKLFLQKLWQDKHDWDAALPQDLHTTWLRFREGLKSLNDISFPRHVFSHKIPKITQLHIFADASEKAYGAAAYIRSIDCNNIVVVRLLCAKSKVAPIKQISLPRLELCAAKLSTQLMQRIKRDLKLENEKIFLWTDSMIVLGWINAESSNYHTFISNRIAVIQQHTIPEQWRHVKSKDNPADLLSRGVSPEALGSKNLWFYGPTFLHGHEGIWPQINIPDTKPTLEMRDKPKVTLTLTVQQSERVLDMIDHRNSFRRLQRIVAYILRFFNNCRRRCQSPPSVQLSVKELNDSQTIIIKHMQQREFADDIKHLTKYKELSSNSAISSLTPFLDDSGILRVGGRLELAALSYNAKHPILMPYSHLFSRLILSDLHKENMHAGPQTLLSIARQQFWFVKGRILARAIVQHCVQCAKAKPKLFSQLMGDLPADRVQPARPFINSGVDFCGPVFTHFKLRGKAAQKAYIAVFCCFATKAVHMELVSDLSTEGFLGALRRFISRRGARNQLSELLNSINNDNSKQKISSECIAKGIEFNFIPPRAPHFGGLWEAAVKSAKHLLQHSLASANLTYEEMETVIIEAEAILNSRPITPLSSDPNDLTALTPAHFLIGEPLTPAVDHQARPNNANLVKRWKLVTEIKNEFWKRWSTEYLNQLQNRYKWKHPSKNVKPGAMVIIKDDNLPPLKWPLGRIINVIQGNDGLVRVVDVKTAHNLLRRPIHKLAPLPIENDDSESCTSNSAEEKTQNAQQDTDIPIKRARLSLGSTLVTLLLACFIMPITSTKPAEIIPFETNSGLYFENLGGSNMISSEWNIITYYDMQPYWKELDLLHNCSSMLSNISSTLRNPGPYIGITSQIEHVISELDQSNNLLRNPEPYRNKRGALNVIGNVANALFGVLDSNYAEEMSTTIDSIYQNEDHVLALLRNQTSILDTTVNVMKRNHQAIESEIRRVDSYLNRIFAQIDSIHTEGHEEMLHQRLSALTLQTLLTITNFQRSQALILDALSNTHQGKVSRHLISPNQLREAITTIRTNLPPNLKLPISQNEILKYYSIMSLEGRMTSKHIIFKLRLPLLSFEDYELFKLVPVPVKINDTFIAIKPSFPFFNSQSTS